MDLSIIIVSWNVKDKLRLNLQALFKSQGDFKFEVFVVDNNSKDGSAAMVRSEFPVALLIANSENLGFAKANNQAIKQASGKFILLLNPDMRVSADTLIKVLSWAKDNPATVIGCHLVDEKGQTVKQVRRFPKFFDQLLITLKVPHLIPGAVNKYLCSDFNYETAAKVDSIRGAFFLINRENYKKISGLDRPLLSGLKKWIFAGRFMNQAEKCGIPQRPSALITWGRVSSRLGAVKGRNTLASQC